MTELPLYIATPLAALCCAMIYTDMRYMRIPDVITFALLALFGIWAIADPDALPILQRLAAGLIAFVICFALFFARIMGGGDTKVIPALMLFVPLAHLSDVLLLFSGTLMLTIAGVLSLRKVVAADGAQWAVTASHKLPMGIAIGATGLLALLIG